MLNIEKKSSLLNGEKSIIHSYTSLQKDGVDYINIFQNGNTELGRILAPGYNKRFTTFLGPTISMRAYMSALRLKGYPLSLLSTPTNKVHPKDLAGLSKLESVNVPNYWALVAYGLCQKVIGDKKLKHLMKENTLPYTCYEVTKTSNLFNKQIVTSVPKNSMGKYTAICYYIGEMLKANQFSDQHIEEFVNACKDQPDVELLDGVACNVTFVEEEETPTKKDYQQPLGQMINTATTDSTVSPNTNTVM